MLRPYRSPLFAAAEDATTGIVPAPTASPTPEPAPPPEPTPTAPDPDPAPSATPTAPEAARRISIVTAAKAMFADKASLATELSSLRTQLSSLRAEHAQLITEHGQLVRDHAELATSFSELEVALSSARAERRDIVTEATEQLATLGIPQAGLPSTSSVASQLTELQRLEEEFAAETDPQKRGILAARIDAAHTSARA